MKEEKEIDFIASRYRSGRFSVNEAWARTGLARPSLWRRMRVAAAVAALLVLTATAAVFYRNYTLDSTPEPAQIEAPATSPAYTVRVLDFEDAPLSAVVREIEELYGVKLENLPANPDVYRLSLHYEGDAIDLVDTINGILGTEITLVEK